MRVARLSAFLLGALVLAAAPAFAQSTLVVADPEVVDGTLGVVVAGRTSEGAPAPATDVDLVLDGADGVREVGRDKLGSYADENPKWTPPLAIGVVYLWAKGAPKSVLDGLEALFRNVKPGTITVYPTPYGQGHRKFNTKGSASRAAGGELAEYPPYENDQPRLVDAVKFNAKTLAEDPAPLKLLFIITDGRGSGAGREWEPFAALGEDLRRAGFLVTVLSFPPAVDAQEAAANVQELVDAAQARHLKTENVADLPAMVESLAVSVSSFERVRFALPWRAFGGKEKISFRGVVKGAAARSHSVTVDLPGSGGLLLVLGGVGLLLVGGGGGAFWFLRRRSGAGARPAPGRVAARPRPRKGKTAAIQDEDEDEESAASEATEDSVAEEASEPPAEVDPLVRQLREVVRLGLRPNRAVLALSRALGPDAEELVGVDLRTLGREDPLLATRAAQARVRDIKNVLGAERATAVFARDLAPILVGALRERSPAREAALRLKAKLPIESWSTLLRLSLAALEEVLPGAGPELGTAEGRRYVEDVQAALRDAGGESPVVLWLVRVAGPDPAGETLVLRESAVLGGAQADVPLSASDGRLVARHAELVIEENDATIAPREGKVSLDGVEIRGATALADGQVLGVGQGLYVVRLVRRGAVLEDGGGGMRVRKRRRTVGVPPRR